jgi:hypothetical protein
MRLVSFAALAVYVGTVYGANWALQKFGIVSIGLARLERRSAAGLSGTDLRFRLPTHSGRAARICCARFAGYATRT